ncbi:MAG: 6-phosphofructokinase [Lachnoclostridium sp.]|nr:6-phosphofructokinase [Lachnoclostridium sp.]
MMKKIKKIAVLTSGGDAPGMNAAIRAVVRAAISSGLEVDGIRRGYMGLIEEDIIEMNAMSVTDIVQRGGTILYTSRCPEIKEKKGLKRAVSVCKQHNIDGLITIGGDGTFRGAQDLSELGLNTIGIPGTIDLDIACTEYTIGFDTACNTAMEATDKVRDTSASHERCSIIEVMGRTAGHIALWCGISNGSECVLLPERSDKDDEQKIINKIIRKRRIGKKHHIILKTEGMGDSYELAKRIEKATGIETRATVIGHIQRGGNPTCKDRVYASAMGAKAVDLLIEGKTNRVVAYRHGKFCDYDIGEALSMSKDIDKLLYALTERLSR